MIITLTPNPSIDTTLELGTELKRGTVQRLVGTQSVAGGKGVNVSQAIVKAGQDSRAIFPAGKDDPFVALIEEAGLPYASLSIPHSVRINTTITEPGGTTTKLNSPGAALTEELICELEELVATQSTNADWVVLAGSLPPGMPTNWYARAIQKLRAHNTELKIAVDTSDAPLQELGRNLQHAAPNLIKPNGFELGQLIGVDGEKLEEDATNGNVLPVVEAAQKVVEQGVENALVTLGAAGALLVTSEHAWLATPPPITAVSTVGAGDCTLAGFVMGNSRGETPAQCLARGVAYGSAATSLPGTTIPTPEQLNIEETSVSQLF